MKHLNEQKISNKIYELLKCAINYSCECKEHCAIVRFGTWTNGNNAKPITLKDFISISNEFKDDDIGFLCGPYEIVLIIQINNIEYYEER